MRQVIALEPGFRNLLVGVLTEGGGGRERRIHRVDDDRLGGPDRAELLGEVAEVNYLQQPPAVGVELALDRVEGSLFDPVFDAVVGREVAGGLELQVPAFARLARGVVNRLRACDAGRVVGGQVHRQDIADGRLADQTLLRRYAYAHLGVG